MLVTAPVYAQLNDLLRGMVRSGEFPEGERFLTERQIGERFGVSRATANKALSSLVAEGVLEFRKGVGTFVRGGARLDYDLRSLVSFTEKARAAGKEPSTRVLRCEGRRGDDLPPGLAEVLRLPSPTDPAVYLERLRLADGVPVILERRHLVARFCPGLDAESASGSLYDLLADRYKLEVGGADESIRAVTVAGEDADLLEVPPGTAGLLVVSVGYLSGGVPLWHEETLYRGDAYEFRNRLGPVQRGGAARPAVGGFISSPAGRDAVD